MNVVMFGYFEEVTAIYTWPMRNGHGELYNDKPLPMSRKDHLGFIGKSASIERFGLSRREREDTNYVEKSPSNRFFLSLFFPEMAISMPFP